MNAKTITEYVYIMQKRRSQGGQQSVVVRHHGLSLFAVCNINMKEHMNMPQRGTTRSFPHFTRL